MGLGPRVIQPSFENKLEMCWGSALKWDHLGSDWKIAQIFTGGRNRKHTEHKICQRKISEIYKIPVKFSNLPGSFITDRVGWAKVDENQEDGFENRNIANTFKIKKKIEKDTDVGENFYIII